MRFAEDHLAPVSQQPEEAEEFDEGKRERWAD